VQEGADVRAHEEVRPQPNGLAHLPCHTTHRVRAGTPPPPPPPPHSLPPHPPPPPPPIPLVLGSQH